MKKFKLIKTPGRDLEDRWRLGRFLMLDLDLMKLSGKPMMDNMSTLTQSPAPSRTSMSFKTSEGTWRIGGDLMRFLILDLDKTFRKTS